MNICLLTSSYPLDQDDIAAPFVPPFIQALQSRGHRVVVFTPTKQGAPIGWSVTSDAYWFRWLAGNKRLVDLNFGSVPDLFRMGSLFWNGQQQLFGIVQEQKIDACLALWAIPSGYMASQAKKKFGIPYAVWCLGSDINIWARYPVIGSVIRQTLENANALFADGFELCRKVEAIADRKCQFLSSARTWCLGQAARVELTPNQVHFLFAGRWEKVKGVDVLAEAMHLLTQEIGSECADLYLVGEGSQEPVLCEFIRSNHLEKIVHLAKNLPLSDLIGYFQNSSCLVIPSRSESIPLVFGEALQVGLPVIVSDVGDMGQLVRKYQVGRAVPPGDPTALKDAMRDFVLNGQPPSPLHDELLSILDLQTSARICSEVLRDIVSQGKGLR